MKKHFIIWIFLDFFLRRCRRKMRRKNVEIMMKKIWKLKKNLIKKNLINIWISLCSELRYFWRELTINKLIVASLRYFITRCAIGLDCLKIILRDRKIYTRMVEICSANNLRVYFSLDISGKRHTIPFRFLPGASTVVSNTRQCSPTIGCTITHQLISQVHVDSHLW